ncbi:MAG: NAD+ synthase [Thermoplasmatota archaeon]
MGAAAPAFDAPATRRRLVAFVGDYVEKAGARGVVLGLSGGVDSALVAAIATEALGADRVLAIAMPHATSHAEDAAHARLVAEQCGLALESIDITPIVASVAASCGTHAVAETAVAFANLKARARMIVLYAHANALDRLVVGTGNKSELLVGYFTKYGDGAADLYPIGDLYKTDVWALAREMRIPRGVIEKPPSAGLFPGQTDEQELGIRYADLDRVLAAFEAGHDAATAARLAAIPIADVERIARRIATSEHKRTSLVIPKLGFRTPGLDWRLPHSGAR